MVGSFSPTHLKNISQFGSFLQVGVKIKNSWNRYLGNVLRNLQLCPNRSLEFYHNPQLLPSKHQLQGGPRIQL